MKIVFAAHTPIGDRFVVGSHHFARALHGAGHEVLHLVPPDSPLEMAMTGASGTTHRLRTARREPTTLEPGLHQLQGISLCSPKTTLLVPDCGPMLHAAWPRFAPAIRRLGFERPDVLLIDHPCWSGVWRWCKAHDHLSPDRPLHPGASGISLSAVGT